MGRGDRSRASHIAAKTGGGNRTLARWADGIVRRIWRGPQDVGHRDREETPRLLQRHLWKTFGFGSFDRIFARQPHGVLWEQEWIGHAAGSGERPRTPHLHGASVLC